MFLSDPNNYLRLTLLQCAGWFYVLVCVCVRVFVCVARDGKASLAFQFIRVSHLHKIPLAGIPVSWSPGCEVACFSYVTDLSLKKDMARE